MFIILAEQERWSGDPRILANFSFSNLYSYFAGDGN